MATIWTTCVKNTVTTPVFGFWTTLHFRTSRSDWPVFPINSSLCEQRIPSIYAAWRRKNGFCLTFNDKLAPRQWAGAWSSMSQIDPLSLSHPEDTEKGSYGSRCNKTFQKRNKHGVRLRTFRTRVILFLPHPAHSLSGQPEESNIKRRTFIKMRFFKLGQFW